MKIVNTTLRKFNIPSLYFFIFYIMAAIAISIASIFTAYLTGALSTATLEVDSASVRRLLIILTVIVAIRALFASLQAWFLGKFSGVVGFRLRENFAKYFLQQPFADFEKGNSGERLSVFTNDLPHAQSLISSAAIRMLGDFIMLITALIYMLSINLVLTIIFLISFPAIMLLQMLASIPMQKRQRTMLESSAKFNDVLNDSLSNMSTIVAYSLEESMEKRYMSAYLSYFKARIKNAWTLSFAVFIGIISAAIPVVIINILGSAAVINNNMTMTDFIAYTGIAVITAFWLANFSEVISYFITSKEGAVRFNEIINDLKSQEHEPQSSSASKLCTINTETAIELSHLTFSYDIDEKNVFEDISFKCQTGEKIAIVGASGSGKSTLLKLLLGLYPIGDKMAYVFGTDISTINVSCLRDSISYVPQDSFLFSESVSENITGKAYSELDASERSKLENACASSDILGYINALPCGFNAILSESSANISGGQRQRIALARALYKDAPILLLDEITASLDSASEKIILKNLMESDKTVLMVAHRAQAIDTSDVIIVIDQGRINGVGTHSALLESSPLYANLYHALQNEKEDNHGSQ